MNLNKEIRVQIVNAIMNDVPRVTYRDDARKIVHDLAVGLMPLKVREVYEDPATKEYIEVSSRMHRVGGQSEWFDYPGKDIPIKKFEKVEDKLIKLYAAQADWDEEYDSLERSIKAVLDKCRTADQFVKQMPEMAGYVPKGAAAPSNLPALANVVASFVKMGWPEGKTA